MNTLLNDFRIALRQHWRQRGFALTVVATLGFFGDREAALLRVRERAAELTRQSYRALTSTAA